MILAPLSLAEHYQAAHHRFAAAFDFLRQSDLGGLSDGRHEIDGEDVFAISAREDAGRGHAAAKLEFHRRYVDIQMVVDGADSIGWSPLADCKHVVGEFDTEADVGFVDDRPQLWLPVPAGGFAVFFPHDAHAPLGTQTAVHKVVVKVLASSTDAAA